MTREIIESVDQASASKEPDLFPLVDPEQSPTISLVELKKMGITLIFQSPTIDQSQVDETAERMLRISLFESELRSRPRRTYLRSRKSPADREDNARRLRLQNRSLNAVFQTGYPQFISTESEEIDLRPEKPTEDSMFEIDKEPDTITEKLPSTNQLDGAFHLIDLTNETGEPEEEVGIDDLDVLLEPEEAMQFETTRPLNSRVSSVKNPLEDKFDD